MIWPYVVAVAIIVASAVILYIAGELLVSSLLKISRYLRVTEYVVAFFVMAFAASIPNLFVGVTSALQGIPELSFGDIMGNNIIALTLAVGLAILFAPKKELPLSSETLGDTAFLASIAAILPLILISDGSISRSDGVILIIFFFAYVYWLFLNRDRFKRVYQEDKPLPRSVILIELSKVLLGVVLIATAAQGVVYGASLLGEIAGLSLVLVGVLILGLGGALPEIYFSIISSSRGETGLILGNLMGAVIVPATLVLGIVAILHPIQNDEFAFPLINRLLLIGAALYFLYASRTKQIVTWREGLVLMSIYFISVILLFLV